MINTCVGIKTRKDWNSSEKWLKIPVYDPELHASLANPRSRQATVTLLYSSRNILNLSWLKPNQIMPRAIQWIVQKIPETSFNFLGKSVKNIFISFILSFSYKPMKLWKFYIVCYQLFFFIRNSFIWFLLYWKMLIKFKLSYVWMTALIANKQVPS